MDDDDTSVRTGGALAINQIRKEYPEKEIRVIDGAIEVNHTTLANYHKVSEPTEKVSIGRVKKKNYIELQAKEEDTADEEEPENEGLGKKLKTKKLTDEQRFD